MMKYQQSNSTFIPKQNLDLDDNISLSDNNYSEYLEEKKQLLLQVEKYNKKISELEEQLKIKENEINSCNDTVASLKEQIKLFEQNQIDICEVDNLNIELNNIKEENINLKKELTEQSEHLQLLYILMVIIAII